MEGDGIKCCLSGKNQHLAGIGVCEVSEPCVTSQREIFVDDFLM